MGEQREWALSLVPYAIEAKKQWPGMRVACCVAQAALETAWGRRKIGGWNLWGIKDLRWDPGFVETTTHEVEDGRTVLKRLAFEDFDTPEAAFNAYGRLVTNSKYYAKAREAASLDQYVDKLSTSWATDPYYAAKVRTIINALELRQYETPPF